MDVRGFVRGHSVPVISAVLALVSFLITDDPVGSLGSIDVRTLCILFCFMATVAMITGCGAFDVLASSLISRSKRVGALCLTLVLIPYVCSMFITNDVALITFVPLAIDVLEGIGRRDLIVPVIVLQTVAANLGSILTPFGNPQNLFLFSAYDLTMTGLIGVLLPIAAVGTVVLLAMTMMASKGGRISAPAPHGRITHGNTLILGCVLFALCIATVLGMVPCWITLAAVLVCILVSMPSTLGKVDYGLLLTFLFLFIFTGNLASEPMVSDLLEGLMKWDPVTASALASQFISNVPAAVLLSGFTNDWAGLLAGVDIGGFGTPIASMASLISIGFYMRTEGADMGRFMVCFTGINALMLIVLLAVPKMTWL